MDKGNLSRKAWDLWVAIIEIMDMPADVGAQPTARDRENFHALDVLSARPAIGVSIRLTGVELDKNIVSSDLITGDARVAAEIQVALHRKACKGASSQAHPVEREVATILMSNFHNCRPYQRGGC